MANFIKEFITKKKTEARFKSAGPGKKLTGETVGQRQSGQTAGSSSNPAVVRRQPTSSSGQNRAGEAALKRIEQQQQQQHKQKKASTLENIMQEEKRNVLEEFKKKDQIQAKTKETLKETSKKQERDLKYKDFESKQLFSCPSIGLENSVPINELIDQIRDFIQTSFCEDLVLMSALIIKNCNLSFVDEVVKQEVDQSVSTLEKVLSNLSTENVEERQKFKRLRKTKIEQKIGKIEGCIEFLTSIGFDCDESSPEWLVFNGEDSQISYYMDVLASADQFPIVLDRQASFLTFEDAKHNEQQLENDFFKLNVSEITREQQELTTKREMEETLRTKAMREGHISHNKPNCKYTRLRFKLPTGNVLEATFSANETLSDVKTWLIQQSNSNKDLKLFLGRDEISFENADKTLSDINLIPAAALIVRLNQ